MPNDLRVYGQLIAGDRIQLGNQVTWNLKLPRGLILLAQARAMHHGHPQSCPAGPDAGPGYPTDPTAGAEARRSTPSPQPVARE